MFRELMTLPMTVLVVATAAPAAVARGAETVGCDRRAEPSTGTFNPVRDLAAGPLWFFAGNGRATKTHVRSSFYVWKVPVALAAGRIASVTVARRDRRRASLVGTNRPATLRAGRTTLRYRSCAADTPSHTTGTVGPYTGWGGAIMTSRRTMCLHLEVRADGDRLRRVVMPLGRRSC